MRLLYMGENLCIVARSQGILLPIKSVERSLKKHIAKKYLPDADKSKS